MSSNVIGVQQNVSPIFIQTPQLNIISK